MNKYIILFISCLVITACSTTSNLDPDEQLYTGMKKIEYTNYESTSEHFILTQEEMEYALATAPNGALFGSSYYRTPFPYGLWIWNAFSGKSGAFSKWIVNSFGKAPVIMSEVNPELRASVAQSVLQNHGYFRGTIDYDIIEGKKKTTKRDSVPKPRTAKIAYKVNMGHLFTLDSISYTNFPDDAMPLIYGKEQDSKRKKLEIAGSKPLIHKGDPFDISILDEERSRLATAFRNNGYYYFLPSYTSYLADTLKVPGKVQLQLHLNDSLPEEATKPWVIGKTSVEIRERYGEELTNSISRRRFSILFNGKKPPVRSRVIFNNVKLKRGDLFSQDNYQQSINNLTSTGIFSSLDMQMKPAIGDTLDVYINGILDKPYDVTFEAKYTGKTSGRMGPGLGMSFAKRNAFRGGEVLSLNLGASYEFQTGGVASADMNNYEFSGDVTLTFPRLIMPFIKKRRRWQTTPTTMIRFSAETINRSGFFSNNIFAGELSYTFQPSMQTRHLWSPVIFEYNHVGKISEEYIDKMPSMMAMLNVLSKFVPKMRYTYSYTSPVNYINPISINVTLSEAGSIISLARMAIGKGWNDKDKTLFHTVYSQFVKAEAEVKKTWRTGDFDHLVGRVLAGYGRAFGNSTTLPLSELFYVGGANDIRAFSPRTIGPAGTYESDRDMGYVTQTGDFKFVANLEYRPRLFGSLYGALFCDVGNVWRLQRQEGDEGYGALKLKNLYKDLAVGVGVGVRYDLDFFVIRLDWGLALHSPYDTGKSGYVNINKLKNAQCINFAIGYPF